MKRTIALRLACAMLCPLFAACGKDSPDTTSDSTTASTGDEGPKRTRL